MWSISKPGKYGRPLQDLSQNAEARVNNKYTHNEVQHSKKRYVRRNIRVSCVKGNTENTIAKNTQCKNDTVFSVINRGRNSNNLAGSISVRQHYNYDW